MRLPKRFVDGRDKLAAMVKRPGSRFPRRTFLVGAAGVAIVSIKLVPLGMSELAGAAGGTTLNIVAHPDDDLLFLSPDLLHNIQAGRSVRTIFVTAGDSGNNSTYWGGREAGMKVAYAQMGGVTNAWTQTDAGISGHPIPVFTLTAKPTISLAFLRLPDGNIDGSGFSRYHNESLQKLWSGTISTMHAVDGSSSYTKATLTTVLTSLMSSFLPDQVNTQDYRGTFGDSDHSDHHAAAYFVQTAAVQYTTTHTFTGYYDYSTSSLPVNVTGSDLTAKQNAFYAYGRDDALACSSASSCAGTNYAVWLQRQYTVPPTASSNQAPIADAGMSQAVQISSTVQLDGSASSDPDGNSLTYLWTQTSGTTVTLSSTTAVMPTFTAPASTGTLTFQLVVNDGQTNSSPATVTITVASASTNLALFATATASSQNTGTDQTADKAIDGVIDGYPGDYTKEWATVGGGAGSWLKLTWSNSQTVSRVVLYDRPNSNDQITGGNLQFSDGTSVTVGALNNDGTAVTVSFTARTITSLQLNITSVSASTVNVGLAEIQVYSV